MEEKLREALNEQYRGMKVKEKRTDWEDLENDALLEEKDRIGKFDQEITETMKIEIELDENDCIRDIAVAFHTHACGDSGIGEVNPENYWSFEKCYAAAKKFVEKALA